MNGSVHDAVNLAKKLIEIWGGAPDTLLDRYERQRRTVCIEHVQAASDPQPRDAARERPGGAHEAPRGSGAAPPRTPRRRSPSCSTPRCSPRSSASGRSSERGRVAPSRAGGNGRARATGDADARANLRSAGPRRAQRARRSAGAARRRLHQRLRRPGALRRRQHRERESRTHAGCSRPPAAPPSPSPSRASSTPRTAPTPASSARKAPGLLGLTEDAEGSQLVPELAPRARRARHTQDAAPRPSSAPTSRAGCSGAASTRCSSRAPRPRGWVRASVVDAMSCNLRTVVVRDCVGDRALGPHEANLFDMERKYADLLTATEAMAAIRRIARRTGASRASGRSATRGPGKTNDALNAPAAAAREREISMTTMANAGTQGSGPGELHRLPARAWGWSSPRRTPRWSTTSRRSRSPASPGTPGASTWSRPRLTRTTPSSPSSS